MARGRKPFCPPTPGLIISFFLFCSQVNPSAVLSAVPVSLGGSYGAALRPRAQSGLEATRHATTRYRHLLPLPSGSRPLALVRLLIVLALPLLLLSFSPSLLLAPVYTSSIHTRRVKPQARAAAEGTGDLTESKARNPRLRAEPTSDTPCPPRGPHHPVPTASLSLCVSLFLPVLASSRVLLPPTDARARARVISRRVARAPLPALVPVCSYPAYPRLPSTLSTRSSSFSPSAFAEWPTAVAHREFALASRGSCHSAGYQE